jgi:hypothetical protein
LGWGDLFAAGLVGAAEFCAAGWAEDCGADCGSANAMVADSKIAAVLNIFALFKVFLRFYSLGCGAGDW